MGIFESWEIWKAYSSFHCI